MNLLVDMHYFDGNAEGVTSYLRGLYSALIPMGKEISFYFAADHITMLKAIFGEHPNVKYLHLPHTGYSKRMLFNLPRLINEYKIDVAHFQYTCPLWCRAKRAVTIHDIFFEDMRAGYPIHYYYPRHFLFKHAARHAEILATVCNDSRNRIAEHYKVDRNNIIVTPNAVSFDFVSAVSASTFDVRTKYGIGKYILYLSRKEPRKNHIALVKAYCNAKLWKKEISLALIGETSVPVPELDEYLGKLPEHVRNHIVRTEFVSWEELCGWYKYATLFVYCSLAEGFGIPPLEAAVCGIPVICSNRTSMADFTFFKDNLVDPEDLDGLQERICEELREHAPEELQKIANKINAHYNWNKTAELFYQAISRG